MSEFPPAFISTFKDLAEGRLAPEDWLTWWNAHAGEVEGIATRGVFLRIKPTLLDSGPAAAAQMSQKGICALLDSLGVSYVRSDRYERQAEADFKQFQAAEKQKEKALVAKYKPRIDALAAHFPTFARMLTKRAAEIDALEEPGPAEEIAAQPQADPPVYYYAHSNDGAVRKLADSFTAWIEKLPRSSVFQD